MSAITGLTRGYVAALALVAGLSIAAYLSLRQTIATQETAAAIVNFSGKRRYTSQRAALYAQVLVTSGDPAVRADARREMLASIAVMEHAHRGLLEGDAAANLPGNPSPAIRERYFAGPTPVDPLVRDYIHRVRRLAAANDDALGPDHADARWIVATAPARLLDLLDRLVGDYQAESEREIRKLQHLETGVFAATLVVLTLEGLFIFRPLVARVGAEREKLVLAERYTRSILDNSHDAIVTVRADGTVASANPPAARLFGRPLESLPGARFMALLGGRREGEPDAAEDDAPRLPTSGVHTFTLARPGGASATVDAAYATMAVNRERPGDGRVVIATLRESTEQLQRYARELERRNRELDQFAYIAAHDLKAPLRSVASLATWLEEDLAATLTGDARRLIDLLRARVGRMEALVEGLRTYATASRPSPTLDEVDVGHLVREICDEQIHHQSDGRRFALSIPADLPRLTTDRIRLWQVFSNLIANAVKHHHAQGGRIAITWRGVPDQDAGAWLEFSVADDGPGISPEHHGRIFEIFQTLEAKDVKESLGLGLALVRKIVTDQGGVVSVASSLGAGAIFRFTWPDR